jgi:pyruvate-ferredoxin/flavodoxin oxidoreductase
MPQVIGGRYGLSSKEFTPAMVARIFEELATDDPKKRFTVGIVDDVTHLSLKWDPEFSTESEEGTRAVFYGLGSDGTVGASKNSVKIIGESTAMYAQGYFVYDSKKAGSVTVSHLRFSPEEITGTYLIDRAGFVSCSQYNFIHKMDLLSVTDPGATFLLNSPLGPEETWNQLPRETQQQLIDKKIKFYIVDAYKVAKDVGLGVRINTVMQTCFFALSGVLPREEAIAKIKETIKKTWGRRGESIVKKNFAAVDGALEAMQEVPVPSEATSQIERLPVITGSTTEFVERVLGTMLAGKGDFLPVSALPVDGTFPTGTAKIEKRSIALEIPIWDADVCIQCGLCSLVCPHAAIRMKVYDQATLNGKPDGFLSRPYRGKEYESHLMTIQVAPDDCTGCGLCVDVCPAKSKEVAKRKAINMEPKGDHLNREQACYDYFLSIPDLDRTTIKTATVKGSQMLEPLFEYSGACSGCGETPYVKLMTQLFGDRMLIGNATGCSSIYGGNLPTTPYTTNPDGRGPTWCNSLFEDNAEFGLGFRLTIDQQRYYAELLLKELSGEVGGDLVDALISSPQTNEEEIKAQRTRVSELMHKLASISSPRAKDLSTVAEALVKRSVWILGGDGWAYDIGFGGLDHVLTTGRDVNILVLDTGVYSNTGGQASKATPRAAVAKFASAGKPSRKKDLGMLAVSYGNVYVAQVSMGANPAHTVRAFHEAESYPGVSLILAYSHCIAHGVNMTTGMTQQKDAVGSGFWPLYRYDPRQATQEGKPFQLDSRKPKLPFKDFAMQQARFAMLVRSDPDHAEHLFNLAQQDIDEQWNYYEQIAAVKRGLADQTEEVQA